MRDEIHRQLSDTGGNGKFLLDLRQVAVPHNAISPDTFVAFGEDIGQIDFSACSGHSAVRGNNDVFRRCKPRRKNRRGRQDNACRVTSRTCNQVCLFNLVAITFGKPVNRFFQKIGSGMIHSVILFVFCGGTDTEVRTDVDHFHARLDQRGRIFGGKPMGQSKKRDIAGLGNRLDIRSGKFQLIVAESRKDVGDILSRLFSGCNHTQIDFRVPDQKTDQLLTRIT